MQSKPSPHSSCVLLTALMLLAMTLGCMGPSIDASTETSMQASIEHIRSTLDDAQRLAFDKALEDLDDMLFINPDAVSQATISLYRPEALLRKILHGKTASTLIAVVEDHRQKRRKNL